MKKILFLVMLFFCAVLHAQTVNVYFKNGTKVEFDKEIVDSISFSTKASDPTITAGEAIDLGLSVKWASCNLGASSPTEYGGYYSWGETSTKSSYKKTDYAYYNSSTATYTNIGNDISGTAYDAAYVNLGDGWRMPTLSECSELVNKCTWTWTQIDGINGYRITASNGNSIFLPAGAWMDDLGNNSSAIGSSGVYWTSTKYTTGEAHDIRFYTNSYHGVSSSYAVKREKYKGLLIRPVKTTE